MAGLEENKNHSVLRIVELFVGCLCSGEGGSLFENSPKKWCYTKFSKNYSASSLRRGSSEGGEEGGEFQGWRPVARVKMRECGEVRSNVEQGWKKKACWYLVHLIFPAALGGGSGRSWVIQSCKAGNTRPRVHPLS